MENKKLGVIADDFTGASDAASFLEKSGNSTILLTKLPEKLQQDVDCIVVALKIRSVEVNKAITEVKKVLDFFEMNGINQVYYKYCSTFDSTKEGNIGPVMDYLLERLETKYTILCPSLPVNGRTVKEGILKVNGIPLAETSMKDHPLNPMWDSYIPNLMKNQSRYKCYPVSKKLLSSKNDFELFLSKLNEEDHYYLVPDYENKEDGKLIYDMFKDLKVLSGGSGLLEHLEKNESDKKYYDRPLSEQKAIIICGSCSEMTRKQINVFKRKSPYVYSINSKFLLDKKVEIGDYVDELLKNLPEPSLVYSDGCETKLNKNDDTFKVESQLMEQFLSELALNAKNKGFNKIIVAGGETSGAVTLKLDYSSFYVGDSVAPGVPVLIPVENENIRLILKSGNFGDEDFFIKALEK